MTLTDFQYFAATHSGQVIFYFAVIPFAAMLAGWMEADEAHLPPWNYLYSCLLYLTAIPAIVSIALTVYHWLFERGSIMEVDLMLLLLPIGSFILTAFIIKTQVPLRVLPWFGGLGGMVIMIVATVAIIWVIDRTRLVNFSLVKVQYLVLIFLGLLSLIRMSWRRVVA